MGTSSLSHRLPSRDPLVDVHLVAAREGAIHYVADPTDGCAAWRLVELASYELHVRAQGEVQARIGGRGLDPVRIESTWLFRFQTEGHAGPSRLHLRLGGTVLLDLDVEIRSRKLDYRRDFRALVDELTDWAAALCFTVRTPTRFRTVSAASSRPTPFMTFLVLRHLLAEHRLPGALRRIARQPDRRMVREAVWRDVEEGRTLTPQALEALLTHPEHLARARRGLPALRRALGDRVPLRLLDQQVRTDLDTPPNRFVGFVLERVEAALREVERQFLADAQGHPARESLSLQHARECRDLQRPAGEMRRTPFLRQVGRMRELPASSPVLLRREGYREVRQAWLQLESSAHVRWESLEGLLTVPARDLPTLFELWCFFALADELARRAGAEPTWRRLLRKERKTYHVQLGQGKRARVPIGPYVLTYNPTFVRHPSGSYSVPLRPDYVVERDGRRWIFDAKYRLESSQVAAGFEEGPVTPEGRAFVRGDLYKMHTYVDAVARVEAAFALYPGDVFRAFDRAAGRLEAPALLQPGFRGVGALPLRPGRRDDLGELLARLL